MVSGQAGRWSLPMEGPLGKMGSAVPVRKPAWVPTRLDGSIKLADEEGAVGKRIDELLDVALARDARQMVLDQAVSHFRTTGQKVIAETKDAVDYMIPYRGFGPSSEAGDIILDEKVKLKSRASAEYARQKHIDETHVKVVASMMQVAMGLGMSDQGRGFEISSSGMASLKEMVGEEEAQKTMQMLSAWSKELNIPESVYSQGPWDVQLKQEKLKGVMEEALDADPVVHEISKRLHKYNHRSKFARASAHVVETTLGAASLTPTFVGPAAKAALVAFIMATGGPEQCKLLKELYLDKRFESRWKVLNEEAHMALENYQVAALTRNPVLLACSEALLSEMTDPEKAVEVLGASVLPRPTVSTVTDNQQM